MACKGVVGLIFEIVVLIGILLGICFNAAVVGSCELLQVRGFGNFGPWREAISSPGNCQSWSKDDTNSDWIINMARVCSVMALVFGLLLVFFGFFKQCLCKLPCSQLIMDISGTGVQISLALVWPVWRSEPCKTFGCQWGEAATFLLISQICYLGASIFSRCMRDPRYVRKQEQQQGGD